MHMPEIADFLYTDAAGEVTKRRVTVKSVDETYLRGWCEYSNGSRTFRRDRIQPLADPLLLDAIAYPTPSNKQQISKPKLLQVHFTGFKAADKKRLTDISQQAGMELRQSVTADLAMLVYGYNASKNKIAKATQQETLILTEEQFFDLIETGALPADEETPIQPTLNLS